MEVIPEQLGSGAVFDLRCTLCPRLAEFLRQARERYPGYHARPVPPFGAPSARLLVVGLAPGFHGANRSGRPFTGDYAGVLLYSTLHRHGFASRAESMRADDDLQLIDCRISNAVKCVPPDNKPSGEEIRTCNRYLAAELERDARLVVILALGRIAHDTILRALDLKQRDYLFGHGGEHGLPDGRRLLDSYHCSRYNTQTGRLTETMFDGVVGRARRLIDEHR